MSDQKSVNFGSSPALKCLRLWNRQCRHQHVKAPNLLNIQVLNLSCRNDSHNNYIHHQPQPRALQTYNYNPQVSPDQSGLPALHNPVLPFHSSGCLMSVCLVELQLWDFWICSRNKLHDPAFSLKKTVGLPGPCLRLPRLRRLTQTEIHLRKQIFCYFFIFNLPV